MPVRVDPKRPNPQQQQQQQQHQVEAERADQKGRSFIDIHLKSARNLARGIKMMAMVRVCVCDVTVNYQLPTAAPFRFNFGLNKHKFCDFYFETYFKTVFRRIYFKFQFQLTIGVH